MTIVNGAECTVPDSDGTLLSWLREDLGFTGVKYACGEQACGACSVLIDGALARACVVSLRDVLDKSVTTVEGLARDGELHPVQQAFVDASAMQCGFCTPGMVIAATALLDAKPVPTDDEIADWMASNVCRCCTYPRIVAAIHAASEHQDSEALGPSSEETEPSLRGRPKLPWDLATVDERDYFDVLGDGLMLVAPPPTSAPGAWTPTGGAWLHVACDGAVTAFTGKVEVGQGTRRALRGLVARELGVDVGTVRLVMGDTDVCPFDVGTFGSLGMPTAAPDLRRAAVGGRRALARMGPLTPGFRRIETISSADGEDDAAAVTPAPERSAGDCADVAAVTGAKLFVSDLRRDGMLHGQLLRAPRYGARLRRVDVSSARSRAGVTVVVDGAFVGVAAPTPSEARAAVEAIVAEWEFDETVSEDELELHLRANPTSAEGWGGADPTDTGDVDTAFSAATVQCERTYTAAYIAHVPMETRVALAEWDDDDRLTVWTGTQTPFRSRGALANEFGVDEQRVRVIVPDTGTGFGGKHEPDVAIAAARLAAAAGAPVKVHWSREEEFTWAYFRPAAVVDVRVGATSDGDMTAWDFVDINAGNAGFSVPYVIPHQRLRFQPAVSPLRQGSYRALAATANNFARESAVDELAFELRRDPVELRLQNIDDERLRAVVRAACSTFAWDDAPCDAGFGKGVALGKEKGGRVASCALVRVDDDELRILRLVTAFECGAIVDAAGLRKQVEGATIMGLGGALFESVRFRDGHLLNPRLSQYRVPRFTDVPPIDVVLVDRPELPSAGGGETPIIAIAPALANAIFDASGIRIRALPLLEHGELALRR